MCAVFRTKLLWGPGERWKWNANSGGCYEQQNRVGEQMRGQELNEMVDASPSVAAMDSNSAQQV